MLRLRYGGRFASWLALIALAIQLAVSFGHVHLDGISRIDTAAAAGRSAHTAQSLPPQQQGDKDDYCAICASIALLSGSVTAMPPQLALPVVSGVVEHADSVTIDAIVLRRASYQSRAPPSA